MKLYLGLLVTAMLAGATALAQAPTLTPAQPSPCAMPGTNNEFLGIQTVRLWPGDAPQAKGKACEDTPTMTIFSPRAGAENGSAVVIFPGGSYMRLAGDLEGGEIASWFTARGFKAFVVSYRLTSNGYILPVPLLDARRAIQTVRARAADYHIEPNRIVAIGFSAGGHLAALAGTQFVPGNPDAEDSTQNLIARASSRPDYLVLGYPWLDAITKDTTYLSYCKLYNLMDRCDALRAAYFPNLFVSKDTPPTFIYHTFNDKTASVEPSIEFYQALLKAGVASEIHIFANGRHGSGLGKGDPALDQWPTLLETWLRAQGLMTTAAH